ncbi:MAG: ABC transporter permease [Dehalococcoidales bacterium]|nr:MAG: ABC transporter permease [Dehalococcoidales bacterium]
MIKRISETYSDILVMTQRDVRRYFRLPQLLITNIMLNVVLLLLFNYVFGGAIQTGGVAYIQYFLPGFLVQSVVFGSTQTSIGLAEDLSKGLIDRFRSLPMARSALLSGRVVADVLRYLILIVLMIGVGYATGFRFQAGAASALAGIGLIVLFGIALTWIGVLIGISVKDVETAQVAGFVWVFPLVFASSLYVPIETMPDWLQIFAKINPVTPMVDTMRGLAWGTDISSSLWKILVWDIAIIFITLPLALRRYRSLAS